MFHCFWHQIPAANSDSLVRLLRADKLGPYYYWGHRFNRWECFVWFTGRLLEMRSFFHGFFFSPKKSTIQSGDLNSKSGFSPTQTVGEIGTASFHGSWRPRSAKSALSHRKHHVLRKDLPSHHGRHPGARNGWGMAGMGSIGEPWGATIFSIQKGQCVRMC
jgi:hypothetical protein